MKVFISWSGETSGQMAAALEAWLPQVIQAIEPWMSKADIEKGARWQNEIESELQASDVGIICLTADNLSSPWIHFEAGALAKRIKESRVATYLFEVKHTDVRPPLSMFQHTIAEKDDTLKLVQTINAALGDKKLTDERVRKAFSTNWPELKEKLGKIKPPAKKPPSRSEREVLEEILELVRGLPRVPAYVVSATSGGRHLVPGELLSGDFFCITPTKSFAEDLLKASETAQRISAAGSKKFTASTRPPEAQPKPQPGQPESGNQPEP
jgi:hypothetical protein